jgi:predicted RNA-binding Zn-ribbon protein involved in translation (DUF1610 family)
MTSSSSTPAECANCGASIPRGAKACPECGADERTGWRENEHTRYDGLDLPAHAFDDESDDTQSTGVTRSEPARVNGLPWYWWAVGVVLLILLALSFVV